MQATPAISSPSLHRIAILMSPDGRFLQCRDCQLIVAFIAGAHYDTSREAIRVSSLRLGPVDHIERMMVLSVESWNMQCPPAVLRRLRRIAS
jgi:hypothetical protein